MIIHIQTGARNKSQMTDILDILLVRKHNQKYFIKIKHSFIHPLGASYLISSRFHWDGVIVCFMA